MSNASDTGADTRKSPRSAANASAGYTCSKCSWGVRIRLKSSSMEPPIIPCEKRLITLPGLGDEQLLEQPDGVSIGHARDEVPRGGIQPFAFDGADIQEIGGALPDLFPQAAQDVRRFLELHGCEAVFVHRIEQVP